MRSFWKVLLSVLLVTGGIIVRPGLASSLATSAYQGEDIFTQKCAGCHTIGGGKLVGPDLQGVTQRHSMDWLRAFLLNPQGMVDQGDADAVALVQEFNSMVMPSLVDEEEVDALLAYLESTTQTGAPDIQPTPSPIGLPKGRRGTGISLFRGEIRFENGGLPCSACHGTEGIGTALVGIGNANLGSLGPDLTHVYSRLGETGLQAALQTLPFPVMQPIYANAPLTPQEQADLLAYFAYIDESAQTAASTNLFFGMGAIIALTLFVLLALGWKRQRTSISETLRSQA